MKFKESASRLPKLTRHVPEKLVDESTVILCLDLLTR